jgi:hypothetical protein
MAVDARYKEEMVEAVRPVIPTTYAESLEQPIKQEEIIAELTKVTRNKAPDSDGIGLEFYTTNWATIK